MVEITERLHKKVSQKFPVMNVIIGKEGDEYKGSVVRRDIDGYRVTLVIGTSNVHIIDAEPIEEDDG